MTDRTFEGRAEEARARAVRLQADLDMANERIDALVAAKACPSCKRRARRRSMGTVVAQFILGGAMLLVMAWIVAFAVWALVGFARDLTGYPWPSAGFLWYGWLWGGVYLLLALCAVRMSRKD